jgi:predicted ATPase/class 3 adenylate cyclase
MEPAAATGTITFLFTDVEGSTRLRQEQPAAFRAGLALHDTLLRAAIEAHAGRVFETAGDAFCAAFDTAPAALTAALEGQRALLAAAWGEAAPLRARMALHTGAVELRSGGLFYGLPLAQVARLLAAGHGGQTLVSAATAMLLRDALPEGAGLRDLGERRLKDLVRPERIFELVAPGLPDTFPPLKTLDLFPHNLPVQLTSFVGREGEIADVRRLLQSTRLLTLIGPGGTGKTRLALQAAAEVLDHHADGAWLVELAALADPALVDQAVGAAFGLREAAGRSMAQALADYLRSKQLLLVLDNCEHLLEACARLADELLHAAPGLRLLVTSREGLGLAGEVTYRVQSLELPDLQALPPLKALTQYDAVRLFIERATAANPAFSVTNDTAPAVAQICHRLDGIPLAIELAAARVKHLRLDTLLARLDDRFRLLTGGSRTALPRQQTLRAAIDWSHDLLAPEERAVFRRLAAFAGGATLPAAEAVAAGDAIEPWQVLDLLAALVNKSLLSLDEAAAGETRYRMLETVRAYAREKLEAAGEAPAVGGRHLAYFAALADEAAPFFWRSEELVWLARLAAEHDNLRAALEFALTARPPAAVRLLAQAWPFWSIRCHWSEGIQWLRRSLEAIRGGAPDRWEARAETALAILTTFKDGDAAGHAAIERSYAIARAAGDRFSEAMALAWLGQFKLAQGRLDEAERDAEAALAMFEALDDTWGRAFATDSLAWVALHRGQNEAAAAFGQRGLDLYQSAGERVGVCNSLGFMTALATATGDLYRAIELKQQQLPLFDAVGNVSGVGMAQAQLAVLRYFQGDYREAEALLISSLEIARQLGTLAVANWRRGMLGVVAFDRGRHAEAADHLAAAAALAHSVGVEGDRQFLCQCQGGAAYNAGDLAQSADWLRQNLDLMRQSGNQRLLGAAGFLLAQTLFYQGQLEQAARLVEDGLAASQGVALRSVALLLGVRARLSLARGDLAAAEQDLRESLAQRRRMGAKRDVAEALEWLADTWARQGRAANAARLLGAAEAVREQIDAMRPVPEQPDYEAARARVTAQLEPATLAVAWAEGRALGWEQAVDFALELGN